MKGCDLDLAGEGGASEVVTWWGGLFEEVMARWGGGLRAWCDGDGLGGMKKKVKVKGKRDG